MSASVNRPRPVFRPENIPFELRYRAKFCPWRYVWNNEKKKLDKPPRRLDGTLGSSTDPTARYAFDLVLDAIKSGGDFDGLGIVLTADDQYVGIDLDNCVEAESRLIEPWARQIIDDLHSYSEFSPSGRGIRIIVEGQLPKGRRRKGSIEMYDSGRYVTLTGDRVPGTLERVEPRQAEIDGLHARSFAAEGRPIAPATPACTSPLDDRELLVRAIRAANGERFARLWSGDLSNYGGDHSAADLALCNHLAFWTGRDAGRIDQLFRASGLYRPKWDERRGERTYGQRTIDLAIAGIREVHGDGR